MPKTLKHCTMCGTNRETDQAYCPACGAAAFSYIEVQDDAPAFETAATEMPEAAAAAQEAETPAYQQIPAPNAQTPVQSQPYTTPNQFGIPNPYGPMPAAPEVVPSEPQALADKHENVIAGIGGAILFSLGGVLLYVLLYQIGFIASISAFVTFALASFGYGLFCGNKKTTSLPSIITPIVVTVVMIVASVFLGLGVALFIEVKKEGYDVTFGDVMRAFPEFLKEKDFRAGFIKDLLFAFLFGALGTVGSIIRSVNARKAAKKAH